MTEVDSRAKTATPKKRRLPAIPETLLVRRKQTAEQKTKALKASVLARKARLVRKREIFRRAEKYIREHRRKEHQLKRLTLEAKKNGNFYVPAEPRLAFVIRIVGVNGLHPKPRKILQLFRLRQINNGVFIRLNKATLNMLRIIEPYVAWGYPNMKSIHDLIYKRGFLKTGGQRIPITDNELIEKRLGKRNIICIEDLIHEIATVGSKFKQVNNALWPFKLVDGGTIYLMKRQHIAQLNNPNGGWRKKTNHFVEGGDFGNREDQINALLRKMI